MGVARGDERQVREALGAAGVSRDLVYNRTSLMLLPAGLSKGEGVERVLRVTGLSFHDVLGLGDAENDLDLFRACGWAGCPGDAVESIRARADWVFPGEDGQAIAAAISGPLLENRLPVRRSPRHRIGIGWVVETSEPVAIPARGVNVLISGDPLFGKSWLTGALIERLVEARYAVCVLDAEGDYRALAHLPGVSWAEIKDAAAMARALSRFEQEPAACTVADLSSLPRDRKVEIVSAALTAIRDLRRRRGVPHWVVLDEAQDPLRPEGIPDEAVGTEDKGFCFATYRPSWLRDAVARAVDVFVVGRTTAPEEAAFLSARLGEGVAPAKAIAALPDLPDGEFLLAVPDPGGRWTPLTFTAPPRQTAHVRHRRKYADWRVPYERRFLFRAPGGPAIAEADSLHGFRREVLAAPDVVLADHASRGDFSQWVLDVFSDGELARQLRKMEARCRRGELAGLRSVIDRLITHRYDAEP